MFKAKDLHERTPDDLRELEKTLAKDVFQNRFKNFTNRLDDTSAIKKTRRDLARVKTVLAQLAKAAQVLTDATNVAAPKAVKVEAKAAVETPDAEKPAKKAASAKTRAAAPKAEAASAETAPKAKKTSKKSAAEKGEAK
jgi:large subunit ribosomal protein L29